MPTMLTKGLRFCCIIGFGHAGLCAEAQAKAALRAGATMLRVATGAFSLSHFKELLTIRNLCLANGVLLLVDNDPVLARAIDADGVHLAESTETIETVRIIIGEHALLGMSAPLHHLPDSSILHSLDFLSVSTPVISRKGKKDTAAILSQLKICASGIPLPLSVVTGPDACEACLYIENGAAGVTLYLPSLPKPPTHEALILKMGQGLTCVPRPVLALPWRDEFGLIARLTGSEIGLNRHHTAVRVPPGDDACLLDTLRHPVVTTDTHREGVHFRFDWQTPEEVGEKAVSVTLSDLAASYAKPAALFINLSLPEGLSEETVVGVYRGIARAVSAYDCALGGGNISRGDAFALDLFAVGEGREDIFPTRSTARPGFGLYITGALGLARAGLEALQRKDAGFPELVKRFKAPRARFDAAAVLADHGVMCVMDISDGLAGDARHLAAASGVSIEIEVKDIRVEDEMTAFCRKYELSPQTMMIAGGEDYELLFACPPETFDLINKALPCAFQVGKITGFQGQHLVGNAANISSFQHGLR